MAAAAQIVPKWYLDEVLLKEDGMIQNIHIQISFDRKVDGIWKREIIEKNTPYPNRLPMSNEAIRNRLLNASEEEMKPILEDPRAKEGFDTWAKSKVGPNIETLTRLTICKRRCGDPSIAMHIEKQAQELEPSLEGSDVKGVQRKIIVTYIGLNDHLYKKTYTESLPEGADRLPECANCGVWETTANKLRRCMRCQEVKYCGELCQKTDWPQHKKVCHKKL